MLLERGQSLGLLCSCGLLGCFLCRLPGGDVVRVIAAAWVDAGGSCTLSVALAQCGLQISREVDDRAIDGLRLSLQLACLLCLAQSLRDSAVVVLADAAALAGAPLDGGRSWPKVPSRHGLQAALCMAAVVNLDSLASLAQSLVLERGEALTPLGHKLLAGLLVVQLARLLAHPLRGEAACGQQDMGVVVAVVPFLAGCMDGDVCGASVAGYQLVGKVHGQPLPLCGRKLGRQGYLKLAGDGRVLALFGMLCSVPDDLSVVRPGCGLGGNDEGCRLHAAFAGVVVDFTCAAIGDLAPSAIGSGRGRPATRRPADCLNAEVVDRHGRGSGCWYPPKGRTQTNRRIVCISAPLAIRLRVGSALILAK